MGKLVSLSQFKGLTREERTSKIERDRESGETIILVKCERPKHLTEKALVNIAHHEWKQYKHGQLELIPIKELEVSGILAILRACPDMNVKQAVEDLHYMD